MKNNIDSLTSTRAFAASLVVIFHFSTKHTGLSFIDNILANGNLAVSYFFVLSGYIMYVSYENNKVSYKEFLKRRFARIIPLYWCALLLSSILVGYAIMRGQILSYNFGTAFILNTTFLQCYFPKYIYTLNSPGWSLCVEMLFYLIFPFLLRLQQSRNKLFVILTIALYVLSIIIHNALNAAFGESVHVFSFYSPFLHLNQFLIGMLGAQIFKGGIKAIPFQSALCFLAIVILLNANIPLSAHDGLFAPIFMLLIGSLAIKEPKFLKIKPLVFLGEISYGIYILQRPIHDYFNILVKRMTISPNLSFLLFFILLLAVSAVLYYTVEKPCRKLINNLSTTQTFNKIYNWVYPIK